MEYIFVTSNQQTDLFPENSWYDFQVQLPKEIVFENKTECALLLFDVNPLFDLNVNIFCDILENNCFENSLSPFLCNITEVPQRALYPIFIPLRVKSIKRLRFTIKSAFTNTIPSESIQQSSLLLLFREIK